MQAYMKQSAPHVLPALTLGLPPGIRDAYYYDTIGNVSTSKLRVAPLPPKGAQRTQYSILELRPRYPLLGGWNYSFTLGWDAPLESAVSYDKKTGIYTLAVPIMTPIPGSVVNEEELVIILPEGATLVFLCLLFRLLRLVTILFQRRQLRNPIPRSVCRARYTCNVLGHNWAPINHLAIQRLDC